MLKKLTDDVWFGNWEAPFECIGQVRTIINVAHHFNPRRGRGEYWQRLSTIPHEVLYFRLARKDRQDCDYPYLSTLRMLVQQARDMGKLPILTHCQMGGHRGPTSAIFAAWVLDGCKADSLERLHERILELSPGLVRGSNYYQSTMAWCRQNSEQ